MRSRWSVQVSVLVVIASVLVLPVAGREIPFSDHPIDSTFGGARAVRTADLDGDGDLDVLAAATVDFDVTWFENISGDGTSWVEHTVAPSYEGANSIGAADLDRDGDLDVFATAGTLGVVYWWQSDGTPADGGWSAHPVDVSFAGANWIEAADVDGDGDMDLLGAATTDQTIAWWENDGTPASGAWVQRDLTTTFDGAWSATTADFNGDGSIDIVAAAVGENMILWWESDGTPADGGWTPRLVVDTFTSAHSAYPADVDGDGDLDVVGAALSGTVAWWENDGTPSNGGWTEHTLTSAFSLAYDAWVADLDGDGDLDILGAGFLEDAITWWESDGTPGDGGWTERTIDAAFDGAASVVASDLDGDGDMDVLGAANAGDDIAWWENETIHASAAFPAEGKIIIDTHSESSGVRSTVIIDVDRDGDPDIARTDLDSAISGLVWWQNDGSPANGGWTQQWVTSSYDAVTSVDVADIDGDGDLDFAGSSALTPEVAWWESDGTPSDGGWTQRLPTSAAASQNLRCVDLDGDGDVDLMREDRPWNGMQWLENDGTSADGSWLLRDICDDCHLAVVADLDGDGDLDIAAATRVNPQTLSWWQNDGSPHDGGWTEREIGEQDTLGISAADVDGDGDLDLVAVHNLETSWWENDGSPHDGGWTQHEVGGHSNGSVSDIVAVDMDADGDVDILSGRYGMSDMVWWENDGSPTDGGWSEHVVDDGFASHASKAADLDGDGDLDILGLAAGTGDLTWWENRGGQIAFGTVDTAPAFIEHGGVDSVLSIEATHRGRSSDADAELVTLELVFESHPGTPLTSSQANALIETLSVYRDNGSGAFEPGVDGLVTTVSTLSLTAGRQTVTFPDGRLDVRIQWGLPATFFVVVTATADASAHSPSTVAVTHLTDGLLGPPISSAEDRDHDIDLALQWSPNVRSSTVRFIDSLANLIFFDDFESGDVTRWSGTVG